VGGQGRSAQTGAGGRAADTPSVYPLGFAVTHMRLSGTAAGDAAATNPL